MINYFVAALLLSGALYWPGRALLAAVGFQSRTRESFVFSVLFSLLFWSVVGLGLAQVGLFSRLILLGVGGAWCVGWGVVGRLRFRGMGRDGRQALMEWCFLTALLFVLLVLPGRGEWIVGGWDPGNYINFGVSIARNHSFVSEPMGIYQQLLEQEMLDWVVRDFNGLLEVFPGVPIDPVSGSYRFYFYRLTPVLTGLVYSCGGLACAVKMPMIMGVLSVLFVAGMLRGFHRTFVFAVVVLMLTQPIWIYHTRVPGSEMTELVLLLGLGYLFMHRFVPLRNWLLFLLMGLAVINRISFVLYGALLLLSWVGYDLVNRKRSAVVASHSAMVMGVVCGLLYVVFLNPDSLVKLQHIVPRMMRVALGVCAVAVGIDMVSLSRRWRCVMLRAVWFSIRVAVAVLPILLVLLFVWRDNTIRLREFFANAPILCAYTGWGLVALAVAGGVVLVYGRLSKQRMLLIVWLSFLMSCTLLTLSYKHTAELYPWATKRFLVYAVMALCLGAGWLLARLWCVRARYGRVCAILLLVCGLGLNGPRMVKAWHPADFNGLGALLRTVANQIPQGALLVADHFAWGVPLQFCFGVQTLNGERINQACSPKQQMAFERLLKNLNEDQPIYFLSSSEVGMSWFGFAGDEYERTWSSSELIFSESKHHATMRSFWHEDHQVTFALYRRKAEGND